MPAATLENQLWPNGYTSQRSKRADLMFAQHMRAVLRHGGMLATVMPHGVLFRSRAEQEIRQGFIEDDVLEAVIGLPPNLFYGTGIPACILVMRARGAKPAGRQGKVLFINADPEYHEGRGQNFLRPEDIEKIVSTFEAFRDVPGYAAVVTRDELAATAETYCRPVRVGTPAERRVIEGLVRPLLDLYGEARETTELECEISEWVYRLLGLTADELTLVKKGVDPGCRDRGQGRSDGVGRA